MASAPPQAQIQTVAEMRRARRQVFCWSCSLRLDPKRSGLREHGIVAAGTTSGRANLGSVRELVVLVFL